ncbi:MAG TPA: hypothetical protein VMU56_09145 [Beijerinckiaceae bacterium]|nr:hypothetical protein [Beijerinckiaceae bacterium]HVB89165.1 hypothetical protein [Beijerinckiaceae bacterium]
MRFLMGLVLGVLITIGAAYIHDSMAANAMSGPDPAGVRMVNWDVVSHSFGRLAAGIRHDWDRLTGHAPRSEPKPKGT